jgi:type I restriction enzyme S subunit
MIDGLQPYSEYKESGQKWLGKVPAHWDLKPGHAAFVPRGIKNTGMKENTVLSLSYGRIKIKPTDKHHGLVPESYETYQIVDEGNIIVRGTDLQNDQTSLRVGLSRNRGIISSAYLCFNTRASVTPDYGYQILNTFDLTKAIYRYGSGLRQNLDEGEIRRLPIFIPPRDEQTAIVRFLDDANRKIDGFIRAKRKLIGLLNEQKQAIIHRAVTRGLNPNVPLKPSGIPWLGDIPQHWELTKLRRICFYQEGPGLRTWQFKESGIQVICVTNITASGVNLGAYGRYISRGEYNSKYRHFTVERGDLMLASSGNSWGKVAEFDGPETVILNTSTIRLNPTRFGKVSKAFLKFVLGAEYIRNQLLGLLTGSCQPNFGPSHLNRLVVAFPTDHAEQKEVVEHVSSEIAPLNTAIARTEREISLMQEYRTRLTADVVTGKLDVRAAAAKLPDLSQEESMPEPAAVEAEEFEEVEA